ncbi:DUF418 domain-containing protein [Pseudokineococcus marinus]|uniref:DUF418 domain-containing protein n=1 Tax=Pseudokineococcus marinus TaxID=351215 RepID=A0A849BRH1_9ACTN|nr:DUF418 domain-containing protein [Pseudokineococcus marinus]NNH23432.1 DUF418 domain-containing protein [Pseudokineococcus marinus]
MPAPPQPSEGPGAGARVVALDVARGLAILGTLATNIWIFTDPQGLVGYLGGGTDAAATPPGWRAVELLAQQLAQGKFLGLLTLMFGVGLELQRRSAAHTGRPWPGRYWVRALLLGLDGLLHYLLVAEFDVLMGYAVTAVVVAALLATSERAQRRWLVGAAAVHGALLALVTTALLTAASPDDVDPRLDPNPYADGSFGDLVLFRLENLALFRLEPVFIQALSIAAFLLGARLVRAGVLDDRGTRLRARLLALGAAALVADLALGLLGGTARLVLARYGTAPVVALGLLALVVEVVHRRSALGPLGRRLAEVGRTALSCYVLQNLLAAALCYGWGLGLATRLGPDLRVPGTLLLFALVAAAVVLAAHLWVRRAGRGPVEGLWRASARALGGR